MSTLIESLAKDRHAARYQTAAPRRRPLAAARGAVRGAGRGVAARETGIAGRGSPLARPAIAGIAGSARTRAGWLLIGLGLRLAMRGGETPARGARLLGQ